MKVHTLPRGRIHEGNWLLADLEPGYDLAIVDGPYAMGIAAWDRMKIDDLAAWYEPHIARLTSLMAPSASVYLWNTAAGWARLDPVMRAAGWTFVRLIVWDKVISPMMLRETAWPDVSEVAGYYVRGEPVAVGLRDSERVNAAGNPCWITNQWRMAIGGREMRKERLRHGIEKGRVASSPDREAPLHVSQKPLEWSERMIRASTRPGGRVLAPFGGTCREAVVCEWLARVEPDEARSYDVAELNQDPGRDYIAAVLAQIRGEDVRRADTGQLGLFAGAK